MDFSDLSFYQAFLRSQGIRHVLAQNPPVSQALISQAQSVNVQVSAEKNPAAGPFNQKSIHGSTQKAPQRAIHPLLARYRRPAYLLCSYYEFALDINQGFTNPRCALISNILKSLKWDRPMYTFWPLSKFDNNAIEPDPELFFSGISDIKPVYIMLFGAKAFNTILEDREYVYGPHEFKEQKIIALPAFDSLLPDNRLLKTLVWNILKQYTPSNYT